MGWSSGHGRKLAETGAVPVARQAEDVLEWYTRINEIPFCDGDCHEAGEG